MCIFQYLTPNQLTISIHACGLLVVTIMVTKRQTVYQYTCMWFLSGHYYGDKETMDNMHQVDTVT